MKKILIIVSIACAFCAVNAQSLSHWKHQKRLIESVERTGSASSLGKNSISFGGSLNKYHNDDVLKGNIGGGAWFELNLATYKSVNRNFGIDVSLPIEYNYISVDGKDVSYNSAHINEGSVNYSRLDIPIQLKPYFRYAFSKNFIVSPFVFARAGASINDMDYKYSGTKVYGSTECFFMYNFGAGAEFLIYKGLAITPKFTYTAITGMDDITAVGTSFDGKWGYLDGFKRGYEFSVEAAIQLVREWTFLIEYAYSFNNECSVLDDINGHTVRAGFRFGF